MTAGRRLSLPLTLACWLLAASPILLLVGWIFGPLPHPWNMLAAQTPLFVPLAFLAVHRDTRPDSRPARRWLAVAVGCGLVSVPGAVTAQVGLSGSAFPHKDETPEQRDVRIFGSQLEGVGSMLLACSPIAAWACLAAAIEVGCRGLRPVGETEDAARLAKTALCLGVLAIVANIPGIIIARADSGENYIDCLFVLVMLGGLFAAFWGVFALAVSLLVMSFSLPVQAAWLGERPEDA
ncbi:MAG: hypothetical protein ACRC7O_18825 [Fimbriiglobus sp.]